MRVILSAAKDLIRFSLRVQGFRPFLTENEHTGSFSERAKPSFRMTLCFAFKAQMLRTVSFTKNEPVRYSNRLIFSIMRRPQRVGAFLFGVSGRSNSKEVEALMTGIPLYSCCLLKKAV